jgi:hypothetical protein
MSECNDPDHGAINAERQETRGLRRAWIELDDKRQCLEKQLRVVTKQRDALAEALSPFVTLNPLSKRVQEKWHGYVLKAKQSLAATKGGSHE